jgi:hypothetical protein
MMEMTRDAAARGTADIASSIITAAKARRQEKILFPGLAVFAFIVDSPHSPKQQP